MKNVEKIRKGGRTKNIFHLSYFYFIQGSSIEKRNGEGRGG